MTIEAAVNRIKELELNNKLLLLQIKKQQEELEKYKNMAAELADNTRYKMEVKHGIKKIAGESKLDKAILELTSKGCKPIEIAERCNVTYVTIWRHMTKLRELGLLD